MALSLNVAGQKKSITVMDLMILPFCALDGRLLFLVCDRRGKNEARIFHGGGSYKEFERAVLDYFRNSGAKDLALYRDPKSFEPHAKDKKPLPKHMLNQLEGALVRRFGRKLGWPGCSG